MKSIDEAEQERLRIEAQNEADKRLQKESAQRRVELKRLEEEERAAETEKIAK